MSAQWLFGFSPVISLTLVLIYKLMVLRWALSSKTDIYYRDRLTGLLVQRGKISRYAAEATPRPRLRSVSEPGTDPDPSARSG